MKKIIIIVLSVICSCGSIFSQTQEIVATLVDGQPVFNVQQSVSIQAFEDELNDGTDIFNVYIAQYDDNWYLYGEGILDTSNVGANIKLTNSSNNLTIALNIVYKNCRMDGCTCNEPCNACLSGTGSCTKKEEYPTNGSGYLGNFGWASP